MNKQYQNRTKILIYNKLNIYIKFIMDYILYYHKDIIYLNPKLIYFYSNLYHQI